MNCKGKMSFGDMIFPVNPYVLRITNQRTVAEQKIPEGRSLVSGRGTLGRRISGEGEFFGENRERDYLRLRGLFEKGGRGILYVPGQEPVYAVFAKLELLGDDTEGVIRYAFSFVECRNPGDLPPRGYALGDGTKTLWDFAFEYGRDTEALRELNPDLFRPDDPVPAGKRVRLL